MLERARGKTNLGNCDNDRAGEQCKLSNRYASLAVAIENKLGVTDRGPGADRAISRPAQYRDGGGVPCQADQ